MPPPLQPCVCRHLLDVFFLIPFLLCFEGGEIGLEPAEIRQPLLRIILVVVEALPLDQILGLALGAGP